MEAAAGHSTLVLRKKTILASMAHECTNPKSRRAEIPPPERRRRFAPPPFVDSFMDGCVVAVQIEDFGLPKSAVGAVGQTSKLIRVSTHAF